eukprot:TRINITY_DN842_c0_g1_i1.p2 TRINITY_DN842_c0_g1~~TRINITY_DN842_c0_g1_i1.p2  ORF type:complete len:257 (+),score=71.96 TRINITY_DN842_c0_g1_i1:76-846(+)
MSLSRVLCAALLVATCKAEDVVIIGDSWGTEGHKAFLDMLKEKGSQLTVEDIAVSGATTKDWIGERYMDRLKKAVSKPDTQVVWLTLMGNDAKNKLPGCALEGGSTTHCTQKMVEYVTPNMNKILQAINETNPKVRVVGFGYDILGCGVGNGICDLVPHALYPHCNGNITCFNTEFLALQGVWENLQKTHTYVDAVNLLGSIQAGAGDPNASLGHPDLAKFSPNQDMQLNCIHPNNKGFAFIFNNLWNLYLHQYHH